MKKKVLALVLVAVMAATTLLACSSKNDTENTAKKAKSEKETETVQEETPETKKVVLNEVAHSIFYAPMYVAIEEGYFADEGIDLELVTGFGAL